MNDDAAGMGNEKPSGEELPGRTRGGTAIVSPDDVIEIAGPLPDGFALARPLAVQVSIENDEYVADIEELNIFAFGATRDEALDRVQARIVDQYRRLDELSDRLSPPAKALAGTFRSLVLPRGA